MLKWTQAIQLGLVGVLAVPALTAEPTANPAPGRTDSQAAPALRTSALEQSLADTLRAIEVLSGLRPRVAAGEPGSLEVVRSATEAPLGDAHERDAALAATRSEVNRLQMLADELAARESRPAKSAGSPANPAGPQAAGAKPIDAQVVDAGTRSPDAPGARGAGAPISTGLDEPTRRALAMPPESLAAGTRPLAGASSAPARATPATSADVLRQGQACFRAGRYAECLALMTSVGRDVRALYWKARALEQLGREDEAIAAFEEVAKDKTAGYLATRAASDLEYLRWKAEVASKLDIEARYRAAEQKRSGGPAGPKNVGAETAGSTR